jgi:hypothetical protein
MTLFCSFQGIIIVPTIMKVFNESFFLCPISNEGRTHFLGNKHLSISLLQFRTFILSYIYHYIFEFFYQMFTKKKKIYS